MDDDGELMRRHIIGTLGKHLGKTLTSEFITELTAELVETTSQALTVLADKSEFIHLR